MGDFFFQQFSYHCRSFSKELKRGRTSNDKTTPPCLSGQGNFTNSFISDGPERRFSGTSRRVCALSRQSGVTTVRKRNSRIAYMAKSPDSGLLYSCSVWAEGRAGSPRRSSNDSSAIARTVQRNLTSLASLGLVNKVHSSSVDRVGLLRWP